MESDREHSGRILAVGGGKGGVGKSFIISSLGMSLARKGRVVMIDGDLGGANLHNFLGVSPPKTALADFFERKTPLAELIVASGIENLGLIGGMIGTTGAENIKHAQKKKLFNHILRLEADYILIDLGAGAHFNTIDTVLLADDKIIVVTPEINSIENMYNFLRNLFFRRLGGALGVHGYRELAISVWKERQELGIRNFKQLIDHLKDISPELHRLIDRELAGFKINLVLNQAKGHRDIMIGNSVKSVCRKFFGIDTLYSGYVEYDESVSHSINRGVPYMNTFAASRCARCIEKLADNLMAGRQVRIS
ncbi:MAG: P-loop NTPase [Desulfurivibrionaceae bacterium]|nr:P-loop NTPase [Desulfobulbales bacterium]MDT8335936.1 P-loop NTPase [Desulfurivibrionaceae bacterium]